MPTKVFNGGILLSQTYEEWDEESLEIGETDEKGFDWQDVVHTFKETVDLITRRGFTQPSCCPGVPRWLSTESETDYRTGVLEQKSLHPGNDARSQRYWAKACKAAGFKC